MRQLLRRIVEILWWGIGFTLILLYIIAISQKGTQP